LYVVDLITSTSTISYNVEGSDNCNTVIHMAGITYPIVVVIGTGCDVFGVALRIRQLVGVHQLQRCLYLRDFGGAPAGG